MDSPFNQGLGRGQPSASPQAPAGSNAYQVNLNRTKTRKWIEAKVQSYDGDDWGADEYDDGDGPEPESEPPVPLPPPKQSDASRAVHDNTASPLATSDLASLAAQQPVAAPPSSIEDSVEDERMVSGPQVAGGLRESAVSTSPRAATAEQSARKPPPFVRPSDIYRRMQEEKEKQKQRESISMGMSRPNADNETENSRDLSGRGEAGGGTESHVSQGDPRRDSASPQLPDVARMSTFGPHLFASTGDDVVTGPSIPDNDSHNSSLPPPSKDGVGEVAASASVPETTTMSPVAQETITDMSEAEKQSPPSQQSRPAFKHQDLVEDRRQATGINHLGSASNSGEDTRGVLATDSDAKDHAQDRVNVQGLSPVSETDPDDRDLQRTTEIMMASHLQAQQPAPRLDDGLPTVPPLRTPSPRRSSGNAFGQESRPEASSYASDKTTDAMNYNHQGQFGPPFEPSPIQRKATFSTATSSPGKDNDALSDEILRSLDPDGTPSVEHSVRDGGKNFQHGNRNAGRESSYTLKDYDSYWDDRSDKPHTIAQGDSHVAPPVTALTSNKDSTNFPPEPSELDGKTHSPQDVPEDSRHSFSLEADNIKVDPASAEPRDESNRSRESTIAASQSQIPSPGQKPTLPTSEAGNEPLSTEAEAPEPRNLSVETAPVPYQVQEPPAVPEPPSPVSATSDKQAPVVEEESNRLSLEKTLALTSSFASPTPPPEPLPPKDSASLGQQTQTHIMTFREIMAMPRSVDRIAKYNETRDYFASAEFGLQAWLASLQAQHPEYLNGPAPVNAASLQKPAHAGRSSSSTGAQPPAQQPYYQQYLNATSPGTGSSPSNRSRLGVLPIPSQATGSTFGHSSNQIGTKSKEFMHSAGKMGKGLLSKGKNKLRGSGDKGESSTPTVHPQCENERQTSWGLGDGRPRADEAAPQATPENSSDKLRPAPQRTLSPSTPPSDAPVQGELALQWDSLAPCQPHGIISGRQPPVHPFDSPGSTGRDTSGLNRLDTPTASSLVESGGLGLMLEQNAAQRKRADEGSWQPEQTAAVTVDRTLDDGVVVPRQSGYRHSCASPEHNKSPTLRASPAHISEDGIRVSKSQTQALNAVPRRDSSFIGLPLIRRSSTLDLTSKGQPFSHDDDDVHDNHDNDKGPPLATIDGDDTRTDPSADPVAPLLPGPSPAVQLTGSVEPPSVDDSKTGFSLSQADVSRDTKIQDPAGQMIYRVIQQPPSDVGRSAPPAQPASPVAKPLLPILMSPAQRLATGPWKLEESHLSEPLHLVTRNHPGITGSKRPLSYGYEKETRLSTPTLLLTPTNQRQRTSDGPPSSAQRYPELFPHPADYNFQRTQDTSPTSQQPYPHEHQAPLTRGEATVLRTENENETAGTGSPEEERGHRKRSSEILKEFGNRFTRTTSGERRTALTESQKTTPSSCDDEASELGIPNGNLRERENRRSSFLFGLAGGASIDRRKGNLGAHEQSKAGLRALGTPLVSHAGRRLSSFGTGAGGKLAPGTSQQLSTSGLSNDADRTVAVQDDDTTQKRKRFSNMAKFSAIRDMFRRSSQDHGRDSQDFQTAGPEAGGLHQVGQAEPKGPPPVPFHGLGRSGTSNSFDLPSPNPFAMISLEKRRRTGSMSELLSGFIERRSTSNNAEQEETGYYQPSLHQQQAMRTSMAGGHLFAPQRQFSHDMPYSNRAPSVDAAKPPPHITIRQVTRGPVQQPRASPLGSKIPMINGGSSTEAKTCDTRVADISDMDFERGREPLEPLAPVPKTVMAAPNDQPLPLAGIGAQHNGADEAELLRILTVSPNLSIASVGNNVDQKPGTQPGDGDKSMRDESPERLIPEQAVASAICSNKPQQNHFDTSIHRMSNHGSMEQSQQAVADYQRGSAIALVPGSLSLEAAVDRDNSKAAGPEGQKPLPSASPQNIYHDISRKPILPQLGLLGEQRPPTTVSLEQRPRQQQLLHELHMTDQSAAPGQSQQPPLHPSQPIKRESGMYTPSTQRGQLLGQGSGSRWKELKSRMSEQMAHIAQHNQGNPDKAEHTTGSKFVEAFKRVSKHAGLTQTQIHQGGLGPGAPQWQQPRVREQSPFEQHRKQGPVQQPLQRQYPLPPAAPQRGLHDQKAGPPRESKRQSRDTHHEEPLYDQVPIPRGYQAVRGEGMATRTMYGMGCQVPNGQYNPHQKQHTARQREQSPSIGQDVSVTQGSVSSFKIGASPSPPSVEESRFSAGLGDMIASQPSLNSLDAGQQATCGNEGTWGGHPEFLRARSIQRSVVESHDHSSDGSRASADAVTGYQPPQSPVLNMSDGSTAESNSQARTASLKIDIDSAKQYPDDDIYDATPRLDRDGAGSESPQKPPEVSRTVSEEGCSTYKGKQNPAKGTAAAELDDTADRYRRSRRLESQEEKILYRPENDENYKLEMTATSYPGQEWNPYEEPGEPGFADWKEE